MKRNGFVILLPLLLCGCMHTVKYKLTEEDHWTGQAIRGVVVVEPIADRTTYDLKDWKSKHMEEGVWNTNSRGSYSHTNLTEEVTAMVLRHLAYSGLFAKVKTGHDPEADYTLSGALTEFKVLGRVNQTAEGVQAGTAGFGLIGAVIGSATTAKMTSEIRTTVKLDDVQLADRSGTIVWRDSISISNDVNAYFANADKPAIYQYPDRALKDAVNQMIHHLGEFFRTNQVTAAVH